MISGGRLQSQRANTFRQQHFTHNKMDILFYDTIISMKEHYDFVAAYHSFKALIFIIFIPIDYTRINQPNDNLILAAMIVAVTVSVLQALLALVAFRVRVLMDNELLLRVCQNMNHSVDEIVTGDVRKLENCVSTTMYNSQNQTLISSEGLTVEMKKMYTNFLQTNLKEVLARENPCISCFSNLSILLGFCSLVYSIVALIIGEHNNAELILLIIYIVLESFTKVIIIFGLLVVALLPLICCMAICCCCCTKWNTENRLPEAQKVTQQMIVQADGTCSICFQSFIVGQDVVRLKCSSKHMFHPICISGWTKIKSTCPICRASIQN